MEQTNSLYSQHPDYSRKATPNRLAPKDGPPMEVVEFSLTNEARDKLQQALRSYTYGPRKKPEDIGKVIEENLPHQILDELRHYVNTKGVSTVYVIRNLSGMQPEAFKGEGGKSQWIKAKIYMGQVGRALAEALKLRKSKFNHFENQG